MRPQHVAATLHNRSGRAGSGPYSNCQVDVKVEVVPAGNLETLNVACTSAG